ncbi:MAG: AI-2E family transporter, partial [Betaproteobacteria bacterium]
MLTDALKCGTQALALPDMDNPRPLSAGPEAPLARPAAGPVMGEIPAASAAPIADPAPAGHLAPRQYIWIAGALVVSAAALHWLGPALTPFLIGTILAYLGTPVVNRCARAGIPRSLGTLLAVVLMVGLVLGFLVVVLPLVQAELSMLLERLPLLVDVYAARVAPWLEKSLGLTLALDIATLRGLIADNAQQAGEMGLRVLASVKTGGRVLLGVIVNLALVPVVMFYLLRDGRGIVARIDELIPRRWDP